MAELTFDEKLKIVKEKFKKMLEENKGKKPPFPFSKENIKKNFDID